jgi:hypothetical protein
MKAKPAGDSSPKAQPNCDAVSRLDQPCNQSAITFCENCDRWFCAVHMRDDLWHACEVEPGDEGGEG